MLKKMLQTARSILLAPVLAEVRSLRGAMDRSLLQQGMEASRHSKSLERVHRLNDAEFRIYSQWGEDGILEWLIQRLPISARQFVEFGVEDYTEANTRFLLQNRNWKGLVMDGNANNMERLRLEEIYMRYDLNAVCAFIDRDNINRLIQDGGFSGSIGILSVDIDGNDYWVWRAIEVVDPDIVVCEYNAVFGDRHAISIPYDAKFRRTAAHSSNLYFGASIQALRSLAHSKGYELAGTNRAGSNAFFVKANLMPSITGAIANREPWPSRARESWDPSFPSGRVGGLDRAKVIENMPVVLVDTGKKALLKDLGPLYSESWLNEMRGESFTAETVDLKELGTARLFP
jgi:hypothetical protein